MLRFPEVGSMTVDRLNIQFVRGVIPGDMTQVDWIRLVSDRVVPTPSPKISPTCRPRPPCLDTEPRCLLPETQDLCPPKLPPGCHYQDVQCIQAPCDPILVCTTPTISDRVPTPKPPPGCYYQQVQCIQAPCPPILVCPTPQ
jgi:hypothetical protein